MMEPWQISFLQTISVAQLMVSFLFLGFGCTFIYLYIAFGTSYWWLALAYGIWYLVDRLTPETGGRRSNTTRNWTMWKYAADYFPLKLHKTVNLQPDNNYIMGFHPHGICSLGAFLNFATNANNFSELYPRITPYLTVLRGHFDFPLYREYLMLSGAVSVTRDSIEYLAGGSNGFGNLIVIIPGGAREALDAHPGTYKIHLKVKKGFVKMALRTGAHLLPCVSFGENSCFNQVSNGPGTLLRKLQLTLTRIFGFSPPVFYGYGIVPLRKPINTVVGAPIPVEKKENPTTEDVDQLYNKYIAALFELFKKYKPQFDPDGEDMEIV